MGCISSKEGLGRSMSIHERFGQGVHAMAIGVLPGDKDRIITLFKIASGKNLMRGFQYVETDQDSNTFWNKPAYCRGEEEEEEHDIEKRRCKISELTELLESSDFLAHKAVSNESEDPTGDSSATSTCRTFHTLKEFDELLEKINLMEPQIEDNANDGFDPSPPDADQTINSFQAEEENIPGWRRKAIASGLQSLMPPLVTDETSELSKVGSLKEWIHAGDDIYSPDSYVTPKFGSYGVERSNLTVFSPELVAAFEECMKQMESEELAIVELMEEGLRAN